MGITAPNGVSASPEDLAKRVGRIDDIKAGDSDKAFGDQVKAVYEEIVKATKTKYPDLDQNSHEFKSKSIEVADSSIGMAVAGNDLSAKAAEATKAALKQAQDADSFARLMIDQRNQIAADTNTPRNEAQEKMTGMMFAFLEKILAMLGFKGEQLGLTNQFAGAANDVKPPSAAFVGPPEPEKRPTTAVSAADIAAIDNTAVHDIDFATVTDGSRPAASFQASRTPSPTDQMLAQGAGVRPEFDLDSMPKPWLTDPNWRPEATTGAFTAIVPASREPFTFYIGQSNLLTGQRFNVAAIAPTFTVVDPRQPVAGVAELEATAYAGKPAAYEDRFAVKANL